MSFTNCNANNDLKMAESNSTQSQDQDMKKVLDFLRAENEKRTEYFSLNALGGWRECDSDARFFGQP